MSVKQSLNTQVKLDKTRSPPKGLTTNRLSTKYLWLSLLVALIPLVGFAGLYDSYFSSLVTRLTQEQLATRMAATQNEFRVFIRERKYELEALADQFDSPLFFLTTGRQKISEELESLLRLQVDARSVYGVVFFDPNGEVAWTFPAEQPITSTSLANSYQFEGTQLLGPTLHSIDRPASVILRKSLALDGPTKKQGNVGLIIRFNSFTEILRGLDQSSAFRVLLQAGDGKTYDVVGQPASIANTPTQQLTLLPGWALHIIQDRELVMSPMERMRYWLIFLMACTVAGLFWLHMSVSRRLNRQVDTLINSVEEVALGNLDSPVTHAKGIEMRRLTLAIERMRLQLKTFIRSTLEIERRATLGQLAAGLAHDIRNPLTTIRTTVVALSRREKDPENKEMMGIVEEEIDRVNEVLENLLNFARPSAPQAKKIQASELLNSIVILITAAARNQGISISVDCSSTLTLWSDAGHIRQVLMNLLLNALEAMSVKGSSIQLQAIQIDHEIALCVSDDGQGMSQETKTHIMEPFFTTKPAGTGLGLAICGTLIKNNGGRMEIQSRLEQGTTVTVYLPIIETPHESNRQ